MLKLNKEKKFLLFLIVGLVICIISYMRLFQIFLDKEKDVSNLYTYKNFLLKYTKSPRLIIEGGSNGHHSMDSLMFEKEFKMPTINLADNIAVPLKLKLTRLQKYATKGDIVIIPLGWHYFTAQNTSSSYFYEHILGGLKSYYTYTDTFDKFNILTHIQFSKFLYKLLDSNYFTSNREKKLNKLEILMNHINKFKNNDRGDYYHGEVSIDNFLKKNPICDDYIFIRQIKNGFKVSNIFKQNMNFIKKLEKKGVKFIFTWPVVVGDDCYKSNFSNQIYSFRDNMAKYLNDYGFTLIGDIDKNNFPKKYIYDTYAHINSEARDIRTKKLIEDIKNSPYNRFFTNKGNSIEFKNNLNTLYSTLVEFLKPIKFDKEYLVSNNNLLYIGWCNKENWGVWSEGSRSELVFKIDKKKIDKGFNLIIDSQIFASKDATEIVVNGKKIGLYILDGKNTIKIDKELIENDIIRVEFHHQNIKSPKELGINIDNRKIKLGLKSIKLTAFKK